MREVIFWLYLVNLTLLILHEMDSAYWKEWELFHLPGGAGGFLLIHLPLWLAAIYGVVQVRDGSVAGMIFSYIVGAAGLAAFAIHTYFLRKGKPQFDTPSSKAILWALLVLGLFQVILTALIF